MALFDDTVKEQLTGVLDNLQDPVKILFFTQEFECGTCAMAHQFVEEMSSLSDKLDFEKYEFVKDKATAEEYGIDKVPAIVLLNKDGGNTRMRFFGLPGGYEINSFMSALLEASGNKQEIPEELDKRIKAIDKDVHIQVYISLGCPYCPQAVSAAHRIALENPKVTADMVDSNSFAHLSVKYQVNSVPKIIINETHELLGAQPVEEFLNVIDKI